MPKKIELKTAKNQMSVAQFIDAIESPQHKKDAKALLALFKEVTGKKPKMWGASIIGFGEYEYKRANGDYGSFMATGFSPRKAGPSIYILPGYSDYDELLEKLGPHKKGKSCLYIKKLDDIDVVVLKKLIERGIRDLSNNYKTDL